MCVYIYTYIYIIFLSGLVGGLAPGRLDALGALREHPGGRRGRALLARVVVIVIVRAIDLDTLQRGVQWIGGAVDWGSII